MKTRTCFLSVAPLCLLALAGLCFGAPAPQPPPPKLRTTLSGGNGVCGIAFSPDGKLLASAHWDKKIRLWDVAKGTEIASLSGHTDAVRNVAFSPDGKILASTATDGALRLWDVAERKSLAILTDRLGNTATVVFSPDGKTLYNGFFWDIPTRKQRQQIQSRLPANTIPYLQSSVYNSDGKLLSVIRHRESRTVEVWDEVAGKSLRTLEYPEKGDYGSCVAFSPDRKRLASAWSRICLWDIPSGKVIADHTFISEDKSQGAVTCLAFSPDGGLLAAGWQRNPRKPAHFEGVISILDPLTGKELATLEGHTQGVGYMAFSPDGKILASASADRTIKLWDVRGVKRPKKAD